MPLAGDELDALAQVERSGVITGTPDYVSFRHELARRAIEASLTVGELVHANREVLDILLRQPHIDPTRDATQPRRRTVRPRTMRPLDQPSRRVSWADAAAVCAVVVTLILTARQVRPLAEAGAFLGRTGESLTALPVSTWPRGAAWVAISVAVLARWRTAAAVGAWAAVAYEIVVVATRINGDPAYAAPVNVVAWPLLLAGAAALLLSVPAPVGRGLDLLGRRGLWLIAGAAAVTTLMATAIPLLGEYHGPPPEGSVDPGFLAVFTVSSQLANAIQGLTFALVLALTLAAVMTVDRAVRHRVLTLAGAGALAVVTIELGLPRPFGLWDVPVLSGAAQAVLLVMAPGLVLGTGWVLVRHSERTSRTTPIAS